MNASQLCHRVTLCKAGSATSSQSGSCTFNMALWLTQASCTSQVWRARLKETGEEVAVKLLDLESVNCSLVSPPSLFAESCPAVNSTACAGLCVTNVVSELYQKQPAQSSGSLQEEIVREAQTMRQQAHSNVLTLHCSFVHDRQLWMVSPLATSPHAL